jgi:hypothetical protein
MAPAPGELSHGLFRQAAFEMEVAVGEHDGL